jgi:preprotein translocase subunit YajC
VGNRKADTLFSAATGSSAGSSAYSLIFIVLLIGAMYFLMIRPQTKRRRDAQAMQSQLAPGDEIVTIGGLYGTVTAVDDETLTLEVAPGVEMRYARGAVGRKISKPVEEAPTSDSDIENPIEQA